MPQPAKGARLGGSPAHERLILANLATDLFRHGKIRTTVTKAKRLRPVAERLITKAKKGDQHNRRQVMTIIRDKGIVHHLFTEIGPQFAERPGGYTRITKIGARKGDNAPMAIIELVSEPMNPVRVSRSGEAAAATSAPAEVVEDKTEDEAPAAETAEVKADDSAEATEAPAEDGAEAKKNDA